MLLSLTQPRLTTDSSPKVSQLSSPDEHRVSDIKSAYADLLDGFRDFDEYVESYLVQVPLRSSDTDQSDCERFLRWLEAQSEIDKEMRDLITDQQSRHAVQFIALQKRIAHQRFLRLLKENRFFEKNSAKHLSESVHINPVHVWATFESQRLLDNETPVPATVLFYSTEDEVRTIVVDFQTTLLLKNLEQGSQKLRTLIRQTPKQDRAQFLDIIADLVSQQLLVVA